jgi:calcineurin-like phosphoesterase family protein
LDPTADAILTALLRQTTRLQPAPVFFANLGDFAGPGTIERHRHYLRLVEPLPVPDVCIIGNHDLDARHRRRGDLRPRAAGLRPDRWTRTLHLPRSTVGLDLVR